MVALGDMSREALVRELRFATAKGNTDRVTRIKRELAKRGNPLNSQRREATQPRYAAPVKRWWND